MAAFRANTSIPLLFRSSANRKSSLIRQESFLQQIQGDQPTVSMNPADANRNQFNGRRVALVGKQSKTHDPERPICWPP
jgi:hypothetical protein